MTSYRLRQSNNQWYLIPKGLVPQFDLHQMYSPLTELNLLSTEEKQKAGLLDIDFTRYKIDNPEDFDIVLV